MTIWPIFREDAVVDHLTLLTLATYLDIDTVTTSIVGNRHRRAFNSIAIRCGAFGSAFVRPSVTGTTRLVHDGGRNIVGISIVGTNRPVITDIANAIGSLADGAIPLGFGRIARRKTVCCLTRCPISRRRIHAFRVGIRANSGVGAVGFGRRLFPNR